mgnify:CR=1 FL=1
MRAWRPHISECFVEFSKEGSAVRHLDQDTTEIENNPYADWIAMYSSDDFKEAVEAEREWLDARLSEVSERRLGELVDVFRDATRLEIDFWQMGLDLSD